MGKLFHGYNRKLKTVTMSVWLLQTYWGNFKPNSASFDFNNILNKVLKKKNKSRNEANYRQQPCFTYDFLNWFSYPKDKNKGPAWL